MSVTPHERAMFLRFLRMDQKIHDVTAADTIADLAEPLTEEVAVKEVEAISKATKTFIEAAEALLNEDVAPFYQISAIAILAGTLGGRWAAATDDRQAARVVCGCFVGSFNAGHSAEAVLQAVVESDHEAGHA
jgi:hypothetical protein